MCVCVCKIGSENKSMRGWVFKSSVGIFQKYRDSARRQTCTHR